MKISLKPFSRMDFHTVNSENYIPKIWRLLEALVAIFLLSTRLPAAAKHTSNLAGMSLAYIYNPLAMFLVFNTIILALFLLSRKNSDGHNISEDISRDEPVVFLNSDFDFPSPVMSLAMETDPVNFSTVVVVDPKKEAEREIRNFERFQSVSLKRELRRSVTDIKKERTEKVISIVENVDTLQNQTKKVDLKSEFLQGHELRRSKTDINKTSVQRAAMVINKVDMLSNEEFNRTIEDFIAKQQRFLWAQKMAERDFVEIE